MSPLDQPSAILIVDDEEDILSSLELLLARDLKGVKVYTASSGPAALKILRDVPLSLIITDFRMPGMNGLEFLAEARGIAPDVPAIMMTAYPDPVLAARAVNEYRVGLLIAKPFDLAYLVDVVGAVLRGKPLPRAPVR